MDPHQAMSDASSASAPQTVTDNPADLIAATVEPPPHKSTKVEVIELKDPEVKDIGWNVPPRQVQAPLINGLGNEDLYMLVRRFNNQILHVKAVSHDTGLLDLEVSEEEFSPDKLRATLERMYITVVVGLAAFAKHIARLRSWNEPRRSAGFFMAYCVAWWFNAILPFLYILAIVLVVDQPSRKFLFPPAPLALVSGITGNLQKPKTGTIESKDSLSGAPEAHKGEEVEQEARHFVSGLANLAKEPVQDAMWKKMQPVMRILNDIVDTWERFGNAISPTRPFPYWRPRFNIAGSLILLIFVTYFTPIAFVMSFISFALGFVFFAQPLITRGIHLLTQKVPNWKDYLELRRSLLYGVPTNAQLTLTILRVAEANKSPLPPPPTSQEATISDGEDDTDSFDTSGYDINSDTEEHPVTENIIVDDATANEQSRARIPKSGRKIATALKRTIKAGAGGAFGIDHIKAKVGSEHAKQRMGSVPEPPPSGGVVANSSETSNLKENELPESVARVHLPGGEGPCVFSARLHGEQGHVVIVNSATSPCFSFASTNTQRGIVSRFLADSLHRKEEDRSDVDIDSHPKFAIGLADVVEMGKMNGYGWKGKLVVEWALERDMLDGLEITDKQGKKYVFTAIKGRDELFNRLIAMGRHRWEW